MSSSFGVNFGVFGVYFGVYTGEVVSWLISKGLVGINDASVASVIPGKGMSGSVGLESASFLALSKAETLFNSTSFM